MNCVSRVGGVIFALMGIGACPTAFAADTTVGQQPGMSTKSAGSAVSGLIDDTEAGWIWHEMVEYDDPQLQGGTGHAGGPGSYGAYTFQGTGVDVICMTGPSLTIDGRVHKIGRARFSIDGKPVATVNANTADEQYGVTLFHVLDLTDTVHVLEIDPDGGWIVVDAIRVGLPNGGDTGSTGTVSAVAVKNQFGAVIPSGDYRIAMRMDMGKYITARDAYPVDGTSTEIDDLTTGLQQVWHVEPLDGGRYHISPANAPDEALTMLSTMVKSTGYAVGTWRYSDIPSQQWCIMPTDNGFYRLVPVNDQSLVVDLLWADDKNGTDLINYTWHSGDGQQWAFLQARDQKG